MLRCHANYGVIKIWKYQAGPMKNGEKVQSLIGVLLWVGFPFPLIFLGHQYLLALIGISTAGSGAFLLRRNVCCRCINFSCPLNSVHPQIVDIYLRRNPEILGAWKASGFRVEKPSTDSDGGRS